MCTRPAVERIMAPNGDIPPVLLRTPYCPHWNNGTKLIFKSHMHFYPPIWFHEVFSKLPPLFYKIHYTKNSHKNSMGMTILKSSSKRIWFHCSPTVVYQICTLSCDLFALSIIDLMNCFRRRLTSRKYTKYESW